MVESSDRDNGDAGQQEHKEAEELQAPSGRIVYRAILQEGKDELSRPTSALFWSGLAAGLSMGFSLVAEGLLRHHLPDAAWQPLLAKFGYCIGFLIVILGRQQLFTENTLTPVLPLLLRRDLKTLGNVMRLWGVVLSANLLGAICVALVLAKTSAVEAGVREIFLKIGAETMHPSIGTVMLRGVFAGWLLALMVWLLPFAEAGRFWVIVVLTWLVGLGHFSHVVAGSVTVFVLAASGQSGWLEVIGHFILPALAGNIFGGVTLVAALNHAQAVSGGKGEDI